MGNTRDTVLNILVVGFNVTMKNIKKYGILVSTHSENQIDNVLRYFEMDTNLEYDIWVCYNHDAPIQAVLDKLKDKKYIVRKNIGFDYGAAKDFFEANKDIYERFVFLNDDVIFIDKKWLNYFHKAFELNADVVSPCVCSNFYNQKIPRGSFWAATSKFLKLLPWAAPITKQDTYDQELDLLPNFMIKNNKKLFQVGNGNNLMYVKEYPPLKTGCLYSHLNNEDIVDCYIENLI